MIKEYQDSLERTIAGMIFGKVDSDLNDSLVSKVGAKLNKLKMEDYIQLSFLMEKQLYDDVKAILKGLGINTIKGFPTMEGKKSKKGLPTPRNPMAVHAIRRGHHVEDLKAKEEKKDKWSRNAKHKDKQMKKIEEGILGMGVVPVVGRLKELAGIRSEAPKTSQVQEKMHKLRHIRELEDFEDIEAFDADLDSDGMEDDFAPDLPSDDNMVDNIPAVDDMGMDTDVSMDDEFDMPSDINAPAPMGAPAAPSFAASLNPSLTGPTPTGAPIAPMHSPAFDQISQSISAISSQLADVKVSEYKDILAQLKQVHQQVRDAGFNYLQEGRKKK